MGTIGVARLGTLGVCEQVILRSICASAQCDQSLPYSNEHSMNPVESNKWKESWSIRAQVQTSLSIYSTHVPCVSFPAKSINCTSLDAMMWYDVSYPVAWFYIFSAVTWIMVSDMYHMHTSVCIIITLKFVHDFIDNCTDFVWHQQINLWTNSSLLAQISWASHARWSHFMTRSRDYHVWWCSDLLETVFYPPFTSLYKICHFVISLELYSVLQLP